MVGEVVVGCLVGNVESDKEVVGQGKGWAVRETEKVRGLEEGQVPEKKTRGPLKILIL